MELRAMAAEEMVGQVTLQQLKKCCLHFLTRLIEAERIPMTSPKSFADPVIAEGKQ